MSAVATLIADMVRAGVDPELIGRAAAAIAESAAPSQPMRTARQERNARYYASKAAEKRLKASEQDVSDDATPLPPKESSPTPPKEITPNPHNPSTPKGVSSPSGFEEFWALFPNKVGKADASKKFVIALRKAPFETIMTGLRRYVAKTDDRPWCNPTTFLNQERWSDEPASQPRASPPNRPQTKSEVFSDLRERLRNGQQPDGRSSGPDGNNVQLVSLPKRAG